MTHRAQQNTQQKSAFYVLLNETSILKDNPIFYGGSFMLDMKFVRENPDAVDKAMTSRRGTWDREQFLALEEKRRSLIAQSESLQAERNAASKEIGGLIKEGNTEQANAKKERVRVINEELEGFTNELAEVERGLEAILVTIPNIPAEATPFGESEDDNVEISKWGTPRTFDFEPKAHWDLGLDLEIMDFERGVKLAKSRFAVLGGLGARLERALINFMIDLHTEAGFKEWWTPVIANEQTLFGTGQLPKFEEDLFHVDGNMYLIPTAEVALTNLHRDEVLEAKDLPLWYTAFTPCFREEAGSAGRDTRGLIRLHQFDKVEMVKFATQEDSDNQLDLMTKQAGLVMEKLGLPYRILALCTADIGFSSRQTYDLEVWLPSYNSYKEISSCSNCGDFQARRAQIKYRDPENFKGSKYVHTLNGSGLAVGRTMAALLENYQNEDGSVTIPEALVPYMGGLTKIERPQK